MTLAVNLANLPNYINSSGQLDASTGLINQVPVSAGGTGLSTLTSGYYLKGNGTSAVVLQNGIPAADITGSISVAFSSITGKPTTVSGYGITDAITTSTIASQSVNISNTAYSVAYANVTGKPTFATVATTGAYSDLIGKPTLATVATSGSYNDLTSKPSIPTTILNLGISDGTSGQVLTTNGAGVFTFTTVTSGTGTYSNTNVASYLASSPSLTTPTISTPTINNLTTMNGGLTINGSANVFTNNGTTTLVGAVSASANITINTGGYFRGDGSQLSSLAWGNITGKPTTTSGYGITNLATVATSGSYTDLTSKPTIPTLVSQLTNDSGFAVLPSQISQSGKFLTTNGSITSWASVAAGGVTSLTTSGSGITVNATTGAITISNTGVTGLTAGTGISLSGSTGAITITSTAISSVTGTSGITASTASGAVTLSQTSGYNGYGVRTVSTSTPSGGSNGDIWYVI